MLTTRTCVHNRMLVCKAFFHRSSAVARRATRPNCIIARPYQNIVDQCHCGCASYNMTSHLSHHHCVWWYCKVFGTTLTCRYRRSLSDNRGSSLKGFCAQDIDRGQTSSRTTCKSRRNRNLWVPYTAKPFCDCATRVRRTFC